MAITIIKDLPQLVGTRNDVWVQVQVGITSLVKVEVYSGLIVLCTLQMPPDTSGMVAFNLKRIIQCMGIVPNTMNAHLPTFSQNTVSNCSRNIKGFSVDVSEINRADESIIANEVLQSICLLGGLNFELAYDTPLLDYLSGPPRKFLTNKPIKKFTGINTQEYLYYFNSNIPDTDAVIDVKFKVYFTDSTTTADILFSSQAIFTSIIPAGYQQLNIGSLVPVGKSVSHYEVYINDGGTLTEKHVYEIDRRCYTNGREFIFLNSLGGMDTLRIQDLEETSIKKESETVERFVGIDSALTDGQYFEFNVQSNRELKGSTLLILEEERNWMQEFFASENIYEINNGRFLPVRITTSAMQIQKQLISYQSVDFSYRYRFDDIGYSKQ